MLLTQDECSDQLLKPGALFCALGQPDDSPLEPPSIVPMDVDNRISSVPAPGSDDDVQEAAAILLALRLGDQPFAKPSAAPKAIQTQEGAHQGLAPAGANTSQESTGGLQSTPSAEDSPACPVSSAEGPHPGLPQWACRAPRSGCARASKDHAEGAGEPAAAAQPQDLPCPAHWYMPPPPDKVCKPAEQPSGGDSGLGSDQNGSWTTRFQCVDSSASDGSSSHGDRPERGGPTPAPRAQCKPSKGALGRGVLASIRMKAVLIFDFLKKHKQLADEPASQQERALLLSMAKLTPEQKERMHRLNPSCREKFIRDDAGIKGSHTTSKALRMLVDDRIVLRSIADPNKPGGGKGNPYQYMVADMALVLTTENYEAVKEQALLLSSPLHKSSSNSRSE